MTIPYTFSAATGSIPLSQLDANFTALNTAKLEIGQVQTLATANGVAYFNGSKVLTTGSALTYNGTNLSVDAIGAGPAYLEVSQRSRFGYDGTNVFISDAGTGKDIVFNRITEQMRLTSTGLGIGTSSPTQKLTVSGGNIGLDNDYVIQGKDTGGVYRQAFVPRAASTNATYLDGGTGGLYLRTNNGATSAVYIDTAGNLGLGVTPSAWGGGYKGLQVTAGASLGSNGANSLVLGQNWYYNGSNDLYITSNAASAYQQVNGAHKWNTAPSGTAGNAISFTQAMTLDASGNLLVGTTSAIGSRIQVEIAGTVGAFDRTGTDGTNIAFLRSGTVVGSVSVTTIATLYNTTSDYRLKDIAGPVTTSGWFIDSLKPVQGSWKTDGSRFIGFLAHELQEASETVVGTGVKDGEEMQSIDYSNAELIANLVAEIQSLRKRLAAAGI